MCLSNDPASAESDTLHIVGSVRCVQETDAEYMGGPLPELPIAESDSIVFGEITESKVFLSANRRALCTEYTFKVEGEVKPKNGIAAGGEIAIIRLGGTARLPSGGILRYEVQDYGPEPLAGSKYLMFLKYTPAPASAYAIMKFWNIEGGAITAAFEQDVVRVQRSLSVMNRRALSDVISIIEAGQ
eukprot:TRINITY_DN31657_c0_g1_i1.p3 TRINITY_DN31657_c0_g1~~TRINITY_DN31657_c0_g1_i1.p3  ORF type:complete len:186 (+),score=8.88 TRINITY_DN31657_c0_g1_i1:45-602(+)